MLDGVMRPGYLHRRWFDEEPISIGCVKIGEHATGDFTDQFGMVVLLCLP